MLNKKGTFYILLTVITSVLIFVSCSNNPKWNRLDPNMPKELKEQHERVLKENLDKFEESKDFDSVVVLEIAFRYQQLGDFKNAIKYYEKLLDYDPKHWVALNNLADIYEQVEEYRSAAEYIKRLYSERQNSIEVIQDTVRILIEAGDVGNAEHAIDNFEKLTVVEGMPIEEESQYRNFIKELRDQTAKARVEI